MPEQIACCEIDAMPQALLICRQIKPLGYFYLNMLANSLNRCRLNVGT